MLLGYGYRRSEHVFKTSVTSSRILIIRRNNSGGSFCRYKASVLLEKEVNKWVWK